MRTVVLGDHHLELTAWIAHRRARGQDLYDEVWDREYHMAPAPSGGHSDLQAQLIILLQRSGTAAGLRAFGPLNLGEIDDFRVPDAALVRARADQSWVPTAAMVVEVVSPDDESWLKFGHYAAHGVDEVLIADPAARALHLFVLVSGRYEATGRSALLGCTVAELHAEVDWPGQR